MDELPYLMTTEQVAKVLQASADSLNQDRYLKRGLPYIRVGRRIRYRREDILDYLAANTVGGDAA